ncbi:MAG: MFS transporter [Lapillicoccus sp.]
MSSADHDTTTGALPSRSAGPSTPTTNQPTAASAPRTATPTATPDGAPDGGQAGGPFAPAYRLVTIALVALVSIIAYEAMAVATAMPSAAEELDAVRSYGLAFSVMLTGQMLGIVLAGVWADRAGPMPALYAGQLLFAGGATICALAPTFPVLLLGRAVTGLGAGLAVVVLYVIVGQAYPSRVRPRVFSFVSAAWVLPSLVGAPLSGWLAATFTWRLVFWIVVPPALLTLVVLYRQRVSLTGGRVDEPRDAPGDDRAAERVAHRRAARLGVLVALAAGALQLGTHERVALLSWPALVALAGAAGIVAVTPRLLPDGTLRMALGVPSVILSRFLLPAAFNGTITYVPLMITQERGGSLASAGIVLAIGSLGWTLGSWIQGHPSMATHRAALVSVGAGFLATGCLGLVLVSAAGWTVWLFSAAMVSAGLGMGLATSTLSVLLLDLVPPAEFGRASASLQLADVLGSVIGIAAASAAFAALHVAGGDTRTYLVIWSGLAVVAAVAVVSGLRCRPAHVAVT